MSSSPNVSSQTEQRVFFNRSFFISTVTTVAVAAIAVAAISLLPLQAGTPGFYAAVTIGSLDLTILTVVVIRNCLYYKGWGSQSRTSEIDIDEDSHEGHNDLEGHGFELSSSASNSDSEGSRAVTPHEIRLIDPRRSVTDPSSSPRDHSPSPPSDGQATSPPDSPTSISEGQRPLLEGNIVPLPSAPILEPSHVVPARVRAVISDPDEPDYDFTDSWKNRINTAISMVADASSAVANTIYDTAKRPLSWALSGYEKTLASGLTGGKIQQQAYFQLLNNVLDCVLKEFDSSFSPDLTIDQKIVMLDGIDFNKKGLKQFASILKPLYDLNNSKKDYAIIRKEFFILLEQAYQSKEYSNNLKEYFDDAKVIREFMQEGKICSNKFASRINSFNYPFKYMMQQIGFALFNQMELHNFAENAVFSIIDSDLKNGSIIDTLEDDIDKIKHADASLKGSKDFAQINSLKGHLNINFDPLNWNNFISKLWNETIRIGKDSFNTSCLRFGTPTKETGNNPTVIAQMRLFLDWCVANKQTMVSFQNQNPAEKNPFKGNEANRLKAIFDLAKEESRYRNVFFAIGIPMDGEFYNQSGEYAKIDDANLFKQKLHDHLILGNHYYFNMDQIVERVQTLHPNLNADQIETLINTDIQNLIARIHGDFFMSKDTLDLGERQAFMYFTNLYLENYIVALLRPNFYHSQCKDAMDRAMSLLSSIYYLNMIRLGKENDPEEIKNFRTLAHFAALIIKGTPMHHGRFERMIQALEILTTLNDEQKKAIRAPMSVLEQDAIIEDIAIPRANNQQFFKIPAEAFTPEEYEKLWSFPTPTLTIPNYQVSLAGKNDKNSTLRTGVDDRLDYVVPESIFKNALQEVGGLEDRMIDQIILHEYQLDSKPTYFKEAIERRLLAETLPTATLPFIQGIMKLKKEGQIESLEKPCYSAWQGAIAKAYHQYNQVLKAYDISILSYMDHVAMQLGKTQGNLIDLILKSKEEIVQLISERYAFVSDQLIVSLETSTSSNENRTRFDIVLDEKTRRVRITTHQELMIAKDSFQLNSTIKGTMWIDLNRDTATITLEKPTILSQIAKPRNHVNDPNQPSTSGV